MLTSRSFWTRTLRLVDASVAGPAIDEFDAVVAEPRAYVHARSRFQSLRNPDRVAVYSVHDAHDCRVLEALRPADGDEHTLGVVREFRRVPLEATALALVLLTARPGATAAVIASLAHFVERAVSRYQPTYVLLSHSREQPRLSVLLLGVDEVTALGAAVPAAFSLETILPDLGPRLVSPPEWFAYAPDVPAAEAVGAMVSPYAV